MRLLNIGICLFLVVVLLACSLPALAAGSPFSISGKVVDRYGNPVQGANVTLVDSTYKIIETGKTDDTGHFDFLNVVADTDTCTVQFSYTDSNGVKYELPAPYNHAGFYNTKNIQTIPDKEMVLTNYPPPVYGYVHGAIRTDNAQIISGIVYLESLDTGVKYYEFADVADGNGSYMFYAPAGQYKLYAQHRENGAVYESSPVQVTIKPNAELFEVPETPIILPLNSPASSPDPSSIPEHNVNDVNGTAMIEDGTPVAGATVTLYQAADNGSTFIPMRDADSKILTTTTDANGSYEFYGVSPATDDGKPIQAKKSIKAMVDYALTDNLTVRAWSGEKALYYPDVLPGIEHDVTLPVVFSLAKGGEEPTQATVSVSPTMPAVVSILAALAIGLMCLIGLYVFLNRKG